MTLPEIPNEEINEQQKEKCQFCGKEGAKKAHERFCSSNPNNVRSKKKTPAMKKETFLPQSTNASSAPSEPIIIISDIQPYLYDDVAWFDVPGGRICKHIGNIGILHTDDGNKIPVVLTLTESGHLLPPFMMDGFVGMLPDESEKSIDENDVFQPPQVKEETPKPTDIPKPIIQQQNQEVKANKPQTKSSWWPFSHKKEQKKVSDNTKGLIKEAIDATR